MKLSRKQKIVYEAMVKYPEVINDDRRLCLAVWHTQNNNYKENFIKFYLHEALAADYITRTGRTLRQHGYFKAKEEVDNSRFEKFNKVRQAAASGDVAELGRTL